MFRKSEWWYLAISILVIGLAFGFDDGQETFELAYWATNLVIVFVMVGFSFIMHQLAHKVVARMQGFETEYVFWGVQGFPLNPRKLLRLDFRTVMRKGKKKPFPRKVRILGKEYLIKSLPIGIILSLIVTIVSNGALLFLAVGQYNLLLSKATRFGRKFVEVTDYEEAKIALAGPMTHVVLMVLAKMFNTYGTLDQFIFINAALALFYMIPISKLDGTKVYFGSRLLYVFSLVFIISMIILVYNLSVVPMIIISLVSAAVAVGLYYYYQYYR